MKLYCPDCGAVNEYLGIKPKFCNQCAAPLEVNSISLSPSQTVASRKKIGRKPIIQDDEETMTDGTLPDLQKLEVEVEIPEVHREKVRDIWATGSIANEPLRRTPKKINKKKALLDFQKRIYTKSELDCPND